MEESIIFNLISKFYIDEYREKLEKDEYNIYAEWLNNSREKMEKALNEEQLKLVNKYIRDFVSSEDFIDYQSGIRILNLGIKIGMELQNAFNAEEK